MQTTDISTSTASNFELLGSAEKSELIRHSHKDIIEVRSEHHHNVYRKDAWND